MSNHDIFFRKSIERIFSETKSVIDIGGGLRISPKKNNRYNSSRAWIIPLAEKIDYKILDPVDTYHPDIVGDIHSLPFADNAQDAFICIAVLEHVENPIKAVQEMLRALKTGGFCFVYVPFLYYYHAEQGYYKDYWRFTHDTLDYLFRDFKHVEKVAVRGAFETVLHLLPFGKSKPIVLLGRVLDRIFGKTSSKQTSGYYLLAIK